MTEEFEQIYEVRGRLDKWRVWYPAEENIKTPLQVFDKEGNLKSVVWVGDDNNKLTESFVEWPNAKDAIAYAKDLGAEKVKLVKIKEKKKKDPVEL